MSRKLTNIASSEPMKLIAACPQNKPEDMLRRRDSDVQLAALKSNTSS